MEQTHLPLEFFLKDIGLSPGTVREVLACFTQKKYGKGDFFTSIGGKTTLGFICSGCFYMFAITDKEELHVKNFAGPREFLLPDFDPLGCAEVSICALVDSVVLEADYLKIQELSDRIPEFQKASRIGLEKNYQRICRQLEMVKTMSASERYRFFSQEFASMEEHIPLYLTASYLGITPTQLSRIRKKIS